MFVQIQDYFPLHPTVSPKPLQEVTPHCIKVMEEASPIDPLIGAMSRKSG